MDREVEKGGKSNFSINTTYSIRNLQRTSSQRRSKTAVIRKNIKKNINSKIPTLPLPNLPLDSLRLLLIMHIRSIIQRKFSRLLFIQPTTTFFMQTTSLLPLQPLKQNHFRLPLYNNNRLPFQGPTTIHLHITLYNTRHPLLQLPTMKHIHLSQPTKAVLA